MPKKVKQKKHKFVLLDEPEENLYLTFATYFVMTLLACLLVFVYLVGMCHVNGSSMNPAYSTGDHLLMQKRPSKVSFGDVVTFAVDKYDDPFIKRVIGVGGDEIVFVERDKMFVDVWRKASGEQTWERLKEDGTVGYAINGAMEKAKCGNFSANVSPDTSESNLEKYKIRVDEGCVIVLGDNRNDSTDSRKIGQVPCEKISGKVFFKLTKGSLLEKLLLLIYNENNENCRNGV